MLDKKSGIFSNRSIRPTLVLFSVAALFVLSLPQLSRVEKQQLPSLVNLGETLFNTPLLSSDKMTACSSCHIARLGFSGDLPLAIGSGGNKARRRTPTLLETSHLPFYRWDGAAKSLAEQVSMALEGDMLVDWKQGLRDVRADSQIQKMTEATGFESLSRQIIIDAITSYVKKIPSPKTRFDRYYFDHDEAALSQEEVLGFKLFVRKAGCSSCHLVGSQGAPFTDGAFHVTGASADEKSTPDRGRFEITKMVEDMYAFKTPTLRSSALRPYFMHNGSMKSIKQVISYYNTIDNKKIVNIDSRLSKLYLSEEEINAICMFLNSLNPSD